MNEQIVGRLGQLLGVAVCLPKLIFIPNDLVGWEFRNGSFLERGWAHGSLAVPGAIETHTLDHRTEDDNRARHVGFFALYDLLIGNDPQWLIEAASQNAYFSHDHGYYLSGAGHWDETYLDAHKDDDVKLGSDPAGLIQADCETLADQLDDLGIEDVVGVLHGLPEDWPVTEKQLTAVAHFVHHRRGQVAQRLRGLVP